MLREKQKISLSFLMFDIKRNNFKLRSGVERNSRFAFNLLNLFFLISLKTVFQLQNNLVIPTLITV
jgi:hypothetical protein